MAGDRAGALAAFSGRSSRGDPARPGAPAASERSRGRPGGALRAPRAGSTGQGDHRLGPGRQAERAACRGARRLRLPVASRVDMDELRLVLQRCVYVAELEQEYRAMQQSARAELFEDMLGASPQMQAVFTFVRKVAPDQRAGPDSRRKRHRQGDGGAGAPSPQPAERRARSSPSTATRFRRTCSRANSSATRRAPSPARTRSARGTSRRPLEARSFSTRSASCRRRCR